MGAVQDALTQAMRQALAWYSGRDWAKAEQACRMVLAAHSTNFDALNLLGIIAAQTQRPQQAAEFLGQAVKVRRNEPSAHNNYGNVLRELARFEEALPCYERAIALKSDFAEAHYNRGLTLHGLGRFAEAVASYDKALKLNPQYASAHNNRGVALRELQRHEEALRSYDRAIALKGDYATAFNNRGVVLQELKRPAEALDSYARALAINVNYAEAWHNQGNALRELHRFDEALQSFARSLQINPNSADVYNSRGTTLQHLGRHQEALESLDRAITLDPRRAEAHYNRGNTLRALDLHDLALDSYERALELKPGYADDHYNRGAILHELRRFDEALRSYERALEVNPRQPWLRGILLHARARLCDWNDFAPRIADLCARVERGEAATPPWALVTLTDSPSLHRRAAEIWVRQTCPHESRLPPIARRARRERTRVGYFSADLHNHATALLAAGLFERHDRQHFEILGFNFGRAPRDEMTERLVAAFDSFFEVRAQSDLQIAQLAREREIDIAVDLKGYTLHQRPGIFAHRAAPIQINYLGYPGTMGAPFIDYIVADKTLIPPESRVHYTEKVISLPGSYQVNDRTRPIADRQYVRADFGLPDGAFVFCSFNSVYKITPEIFHCWMRMLGAIDGSVLWLLAEDATASANLRKAASEAGVDAQRLIFGDRLPAPEHLARHRLADLFIDTFPCNAHTTASDALWAGLPLLTCAGEAFASRVAASLLNAVGLPELIATSLGQYEALAIRLAREPSQLAELRARLQRNRLTSTLFDTSSYTRYLEDAYRQMYDRYQADLDPDHIQVTGPGG
ncbi:MAG TPA: tetratricopeptide repeat protein [Steroidobacteraceae bacterium]|nr:tetratricopeptide repeat protein [Steroidobacteraceae bacterium]